MNEVGPSKTAMVLAGGGAHGAYEVGVMIALFQGDSPATAGLPLEVNQFAGTSVGAYNAAAMVAGASQGFAQSARRLRQIWLEQIARQPGGCDNGVFRIRGAEFANLRCLLRPNALALALGDGGYFLRGLTPAASRFAQVAGSLQADALVRAMLEQINVSAALDMSPFHELLRSTVPIDSLRSSELILKAVATNFDTGGLAVFTREKIVDPIGHAAILASAAIPGFFPPVVVEGALHVDGGALMNTPLAPAVHGSDTLHVVYMDPSVASIRVEDLQSTLGIIDRMLTTSFAFSMNQGIAMIEDFNRSLDLLGTLGRAADSDPQARALARAGAALAARLRGSEEFTPTTIHRYHPTDDLGGALGFLDFSYQQVNFLIDRGYRDAVDHDCAASGCVLPGGKEGA
jgi:NTE family protein